MQQPALMESVVLIQKRYNHPKKSILINAFHDQREALLHPLIQKLTKERDSLK